MPEAARFRDKAVECRARAQTARDSVIYRELISLAEHYEQWAADLEMLVRAPLRSWAS